MRVERIFNICDIYTYTVLNENANLKAGHFHVILSYSYSCMMQSRMKTISSEIFIICSKFCVECKVVYIFTYLFTSDITCKCFSRNNNIIKLLI